MHSWLCSSSALLNRVAFNWLTFWNRNNSTYNSFKNHQPSNGSCYTSDLFDFMLLDKPQVAFENCCVLLGTTSFHFLVALCAGVIVVVPLGCNLAPWVGWAWDNVPCSASILNCNLYQLRSCLEWLGNIIMSNISFPRNRYCFNTPQPPAQSWKRNHVSSTAKQARHSPWPRNPKHRWDKKDWPTGTNKGQLCT